MSSPFLSSVFPLSSASRRSPAASASRRAAALTAASALALGACGSATTPVSAEHSTVAAAATGDPQHSNPEHSDLRLERGWAKAGSGSMTGAFGILRNEGDVAVRVSSATSPAAARVELHDTVKSAEGQMQMQQAPDGFRVPSGGRLALEPGGRHVMLMGLKGPLEVGTTVEVTLTTAEGKALTVDLPVREFAGAEETYVPHASTTHAP